MWKGHGNKDAHARLDCTREMKQRCACDGVEGGRWRLVGNGLNLEKILRAVLQQGRILIFQELDHIPICFSLIPVKALFIGIPNPFDKGPTGRSWKPENKPLNRYPAKQGKYQHHGESRRITLKPTPPQLSTQAAHPKFSSI